MQMVWKSGNNVYRFPIHYITVEDTVIEDFGGAIAPAETVIASGTSVEISDPAIPEADDEIINTPPTMWNQDSDWYSDEDFAWSDIDEYPISL